MASFWRRNNRDHMQQDGWKARDGKMSRKIWNAQSRTTFLRHSAVFLRKVCNNLKKKTLQSTRT